MLCILIIQTEQDVSTVKQFTHMHYCDLIQQYTRTNSHSAINAPKRLKRFSRFVKCHQIGPYFRAVQQFNRSVRTFEKLNEISGKYQMKFVQISHITLKYLKYHNVLLCLQIQLYKVIKQITHRVDYLSCGLLTNYQCIQKIEIKEFQ